jgi:peptidyl-Asp metalloendopeptidase
MIKILLVLNSIIWLFSGCTQPEKDSPNSTTIRVLLAYSESDTGKFEDYQSKIKVLFSETQAVYTNSKTNVKFEIASIVKIPFQPEERVKDLIRLVRKKDGYIDNIHEIRDSLEADIVVLISPLTNATINGSILATESTAFVIVAWEDFEAPIYGLAHEMAHLFGAMHPGATGPVSEQFPQGFPWGSDSIKTVLDWNSGNTIPYFSSPDIQYQGVSIGETGKKDISSVIRSTAVYISNFRGKIEKTEFVPKGTIPSADFSE